MTDKPISDPVSAKDSAESLINCQVGKKAWENNTGFSTIVKMVDFSV